MIRFRTVAAIMIASSTGLACMSATGNAQDGWRPFADGDRPARRQSGPIERSPLPPMDGIGTWTVGPKPAPGPSEGRGLPGALAVPVERSELPPVLANDGSGLPLEAWRGLDLAAAERLMSQLELPPQSPTLRQLWHRLLSSGAGGLQGTSPGLFTAVRVEGLYRSGMLEALDTLLKPAGAGGEALIAALHARVAIAVGRREEGCEAVRRSAASKSELPPPLRRELLALTGYCAAASGNPAAAALAGELAREEGLDDAALLDALDAVASGRTARVPRGVRIGPTYYRLLQIGNAADPAMVLERADPSLLAALALDPASDERLRLAATEKAARLNVIGGAALTRTWRAQRFSAAQLSEAMVAKSDPLFRRALLFQAAEAENQPAKRARILRALLDDARSAGLYVAALTAVAPIVAKLPKSAELSWFTETAIEAGLAAGDHALSRFWAAGTDPATGAPHSHWLALADIADAELRSPRGAGLSAVEEMARRGRFSSAILHRLATVLDALDYNVPMGLWQLASSTPQPNDGHLPETGVLAQLGEASVRRDFARTVLLAMHSLGPKGPEGAHIIALGDTIRALRRIGLEAEARGIAFEALFAAWPRFASN